jgi:hypothetical protein
VHLLSGDGIALLFLVLILEAPALVARRGEGIQTLLKLAQTAPQPIAPSVVGGGKAIVFIAGGVLILRE